MNLNRKYGFLNNSRDMRLFYSLVMPDEYSKVWIFCNPFLEEKVYTHSVYKYFSDFLAKRGDAVIRFDYQGDGDSEGVLDDIELDDWCNDIIDISQFISSTCNISSINLFGLRLGASLAWKVASEIKVDNLLMWDPIIDGEDYLNQLLRFNLTTQLATYGEVRDKRSKLLQRFKVGKIVNILGHDINKQLASSLCATQLSSKNIPDSRISIVASSISSNPKPSEQLSELISGGHINISMAKARPFWHEPKFIDFRQQTMIDVSMVLLDIKDNSGSSK